MNPLREILTIATGPVVMLAEQLCRIDGEPEWDAVYKACSRTVAAVHRPVNPAILTAADFAAPSGFLDDVCSGPRAASLGAQGHRPPATRVGRGR